MDPTLTACLSRIFGFIGLLLETVSFFFMAPRLIGIPRLEAWASRLERLLKRITERRDIRIRLAIHVMFFGFLIILWVMYLLPSEWIREVGSVLSALGKGVCPKLSLGAVLVLILLWLWDLFVQATATMWVSDQLLMLIRRWLAYMAKDKDIQQRSFAFGAVLFVLGMIFQCVNVMT